METQQFCLKWNSHQANMLTVFEQLLSTEALVDVTLACDGLSLKAHKVVLSACSPYFQSLFVDNPCKHPIVIMKDMRYSDLKAIIDFMYKGEVNVSHDQLNALLKTAETLKVKGLAEMSGENRAASAGAVQQNTSSPPPPTNIPVTQTRSDSPAMLSKRKHGRPRKRFRSGSVHSDEEIVPTKIKEPESPEIEELPQDPSDSISDSIPVSSKHQTPVHSSAVNNSHLSRKSQSSRSSHQTEEPPSESDFSIEPSKLMEQTLTTTPVISNGLAQSSSSGISVNTPSSLSIVPTSLSIVPASCESQLSVATDSHSSNQTQGPDSPQDVKPLLSFEEPLISVDPSQDGSSFMDSSGVPSIAGTSSSYQEDQTALVPQDSQSQELNIRELLLNPLRTTMRSLRTRTSYRQVPSNSLALVPVTQPPPQSLELVPVTQPPSQSLELVPVPVPRNNEFLLRWPALKNESFTVEEPLNLDPSPVSPSHSNQEADLLKCFKTAMPTVSSPALQNSLSQFTTSATQDLAGRIKLENSNAKARCPHCSLTTNDLPSFRKHLVDKHSGPKKMSCPLCSKKFKYSASVYMHLYLHTGEKPFNCNKCEKSFTQRSHLDGHKKRWH